MEELEKDTMDHVSHSEDLDARDKSKNQSLDSVADTGTTRAEKRLILKQDLIILPLMSLTLFCGYLDRGNIGNARVLGMQADVGLTNQQFFNCVSMFYIGYMTLELPAAMTIRYCHPRYIFFASLLTFGICAACMAPGQSYAGVMTLRVIIGLGEAFTQVAYIYITLWYKPSELALRTAAIYAMTPVAGAISGLIAYGVGKNQSEVGNMAAWEWLFIIEGACTIGFAFIVLLLCPGLPEDVAEKGSWLFRHEKERQLILHRFKQTQNSLHAKFRPHQIVMALKDPKLYLGSMIVGAQGVGIGAFSVFLPTFIKQFGFSALKTQLYSMIPYAFGLLTLIIFSYLADRLGKKGVMTIICLCTSITGFIILIASTNKVALIAGASFVAAGAYPGVAVSVSWYLSSHGGYTKRSTAVWFSAIFIQTESIVASQVYRNPPRFFTGHGVSLGFYVAAVISSVILMSVLKLGNKKKEKRAAEFAARDEVDPDMAEDFERLCDFHPGFKYAL